VGAGPGDPELLTLKAVRRLEAAEVVLHDALLPEEILAMVPRAAELINVGKRCGMARDRGAQQKEINELMLTHARRGRSVVRLKCGDPFVFGRGGEEIEYLAEHGVSAEVVPGISACLGAAASLQVPLTHRTMGANQLRLVVGQTKAFVLPDLNWSELASNADKQTVVFYMGFKSLDGICERLLAHGISEDTPMMLVESATTPMEAAAYGTVKTLPGIAKENPGQGGPVLMFLGPTVAFPDRLEQMSGGRAKKRQRVGDLNEM
jgi:uroporphyrin-III C-methyltransferase/precorrin-2 dehydrogenase/sirohydrochlorin ferrochelatase/uroporphyrin-III C-methyltransferase